MERTSQPRTWVWFLLAGLAAPVFSAALAPDRSSAHDSSTRCPATEFVVREAGQCLLYPSTRWERVNDIAGVRLQTCREQLTALRNLGFHEDEAYRAAQWMQTHDGGLPVYWRATLGRSFCGDAEFRAARSTAEAGR